MDTKILIFATNNRHKLDEVRQILGDSYRLETPREHGIDEDIPETQPTIEGNALQKARYVHERTGRDCFADDTGLEVEALGGAPGVYSARYAGPGCSFEDNMDKLLGALEGVENRRARFRTVIALIIGGEEHLFEGTVEGVITHTRHGTEGFGYDPVFRPDGHHETFAEMPAEAKNAISHRGRATAKLSAFLAGLNQKRTRP
jgi:XTP/dITP diphosphohydrolase